MNKPNYTTASLQALIQHVFHSTDTLESITYGELAERIGRLNRHGVGHGHGMGKVLGDMGHRLQEVEKKWGKPIPHIQSLVVNKIGPLQGLPDDGIKEFWKDYPSLTMEEKINKVRIEHEKIMRFGSHWNKVLSELKLPEIKTDSEGNDSNCDHYGIGGESPQHVALKEYLRNHPELVGANVTDVAIIEYPLPSLDEIDIVFKGSPRCIAVEVKSRISDRMRQDYERGIYQCVKYRAILEAMNKDERYSMPEKIDAVLVLETALPAKLKSVANSLNIRVIENVCVEDGE